MNRPSGEYQYTWERDCHQTLLWGKVYLSPVFQSQETPSSRLISSLICCFGGVPGLIAQRMADGQIGLMAVAAFT